MKHKINLLPYVRVQTILTAYAGLVAGILYAGIGMIIDLSTVGWNHGTSLAFIAIPIMPLYFAVIGFVVALVSGTLYNYSLKWWDGIDLKIKK